MDNLDRIEEILQRVGRIWSECPVENVQVRDDLCSIVDNIQMIKAEMLELRHNANAIEPHKRNPDRKMTNFDRIQGMSRSELAMFLDDITDCCFQDACDSCWLKGVGGVCDSMDICVWLGQEDQSDG